MAGLKSTACDGEVGGVGVARDVGVAGNVHRDVIRRIITVAAAVGDVAEGGAGGVELLYQCVKAVSVSGVAGLISTARGGEVGGLGVARDVSVPRAPHRDATRLISTIAAEVGAVAE